VIPGAARNNWGSARGYHELSKLLAALRSPAIARRTVGPAVFLYIARLRRELTILPQTGRIRHGQAVCGPSEGPHRGLRWASSGANDPGEEYHGSCCDRRAVWRIGGAFLGHPPSGVIGKSDLWLLRPRPVVQEAGH
jgi:hypothetical protein